MTGARNDNHIDTDDIPNEMLLQLFDQIENTRVLAHVRLVSRLWYAGVDQLAKNRLRKYFPDKYSQLSHSDYQKSIGEVNWFCELSATLRQICHGFENDELISYLYIRAFNVEQIEIILKDDKRKSYIFLKDGAGNTIFDYLQNCPLVAKQKINDLIFKTFSEQLNNSLFDPKTNQYPWAHLVSEFNASDAIAAKLLLAVMCHQNEVILQCEIKDEQLPKLLALALDMHQPDTFLILLAKKPELIFKLIYFQNVRAEWCFDLETSQKLFQIILQLTLNDDPHKRTLLQWAVILNQQEYIKQSTPINLPELSQKINGDFPVDFACHHIDLRLVHCLQEKNATLISQSNNILANAAFCGNILLLQKLLSDKTIATPHQLQRALSEAVSTGQLNSVMLLLKHGAIIDDKIINTAISSAQFHLLRYFAARPEWQTHIKNVSFSACATLISNERNFQIFKFLVDHGLNIKICDTKTDKNLLHIIGEKSLNAPRLIHYLVEKGVDINAYDKKKCTPLTYVFKNLPTNVDPQPFLSRIIQFILADADTSLLISNHSQRFLAQQTLANTERRVINELDRLSPQNKAIVLATIENAKTIRSQNNSVNLQK